MVTFTLCRRAQCVGFFGCIDPSVAKFVDGQRYVKQQLHVRASRLVRERHLRVSLHRYSLVLQSDLRLSSTDEVGNRFAPLGVESAKRSRHRIKWEVLESFLTLSLAGLAQTISTRTPGAGGAIAWGECKLYGTWQFNV
jgi:hypothetical protein